MKKVTIKQAVSGYGDIERKGNSSFSFKSEQVVEIEDNLAAAWVASGIAQWAPKDRPKQEFAVVPKPEPVEVPKVIVPDTKAEPKIDPKADSKESK